MASVFQKFGGTRPMAAKVGEAVSTVNSWRAKNRIPRWRHASILEAAGRFEIPLEADELVNIRPDEVEAAAGEQSAAA